MPYGIEQLLQPVEQSDTNTLSGLIRLASGPASRKVYRELTDHVESYADPSNENTVLYVARTALMSFSYLDTPQDIIGFATEYIQRDGDQTGAHVENLYVHPVYRGRNVGKFLVQACVQFGNYRGADYVQIDQPLEAPGATLLEGLLFENVHETPRIPLR